MRLKYDRPSQKTQFDSPLELPIVVEPKRKLRGAIKKLVGPKPIPALQISMRDAIRAAERHVFVEGLPANPIDLVESFVAAFTWEFDAYWTVDAENNVYYPKSPPELSLTTEHTARCGELIAEGLALLFLERRLGVSRANCDFLAPHGNRPRLDYGFTPIHGSRLAIVRPNFPRAQLEVRSRKGKIGLNSGDMERLDRKKGSHRGPTLAIYCSYGAITSAYRGSHLILADPPGDDSPASIEAAIPTILRNYERITGRIGMLDSNARLRREMRAMRIGGSLPPNDHAHEQDQQAIVAHRSFGDSSYVGRLSSGALLRARRSTAEAQRVLARIEARKSVGNVVFHGLNQVAHRLIESGNYGDLALFLDDGGFVGKHSQHVAGKDVPIITGDGVLRVIDTPAFESQEARAIIAQVRLLAKGSA